MNRSETVMEDLDIISTKLILLKEHSIILNLTLVISTMAPHKIIKIQIYIFANQIIN